jgi:uncharacterized protein YlxP (DUF503 family)
VSATIGRARVAILFESTFSIKEKRGEVKSVLKRVQNQFNAAAAEIETLNDMRTGTIGIVVLSNDASHANAMLDTIVTFIERSLDLGYLGDVEIELFSFDG